MVTISNAIFQAVGTKGLDKMIPVIRPDRALVAEDGGTDYGVVSLHPTYESAERHVVALEAQGVTDAMPWERFTAWMDKFHSEGCTIHFV